MDYKIKDIRLAEQGNRQLEWAAMHMPALEEIRKDFSPEEGTIVSLAGNPTAVCWMDDRGVTQPFFCTQGIQTRAWYR